MNDVNWWLMALAFVLGLVLTLALTIRKVKREVPVYAALGRGPGGVAANLPEVDDATTKLPKANAPKAAGGVDDATTKLPKATAAGAAVAGAAAADAAKLTGGAAGSKPEVAEESPFGAGSVRLAVGSADAPEGYTVKGNEDSMLYHTTESPQYRQTIAEIWFVDVESAEKGGFNRWDSGKSQRGKK